MDVPYVCDAIDVSLLYIVYSTTHHILWLHKSKRWCVMLWLQKC